MTAPITSWTCTVCSKPATTTDGIVGAYLCDSSDCLTEAWSRARTSDDAGSDPARERLHQLIAAAAQREYEDSITTLGTVAHAEHLGSRIAAEVMRVLDAGRLLLPAGTKTEEQFAAQVEIDGEPASPFPDSMTRQAAEVRKRAHDRERALNPGWRGTCTVLHRWQHTTPWEPVPTEEAP